MMQNVDLENSQEALNKALNRAKMGEDKDLAGQVRDSGERLVRLLYGLIKMLEIHALDNDAFLKPSEEFSIVSHQLFDLLGAIHIVMVEDQVFVNDIRIRFGRATGASSLSEDLKPHQVGGLSLHQPPTPAQVKTMVSLFAADPDESAPRAALIEAFEQNGLNFIDLMGIYRFRISGETEVVKKDMGQISSRASSLVDEAWDNLGADRTPNPLPLRRAVADILSANENEAGGLLADAKKSDRYGDHAMQVCQISLMLAKEANLSEENIQDLGVAAMFHDMGYAAREGADIKKGEAGFAPPFERHGAAGARMLLRQRGFNPAKIYRALSALEHHRDYDYEGGKPSLFARIIRIAEDFANMTSLRAGAMNPHEALGRMLSGAGTRYDPTLMQLFVNKMGKYPPGSILDVEIKMSMGPQRMLLLASSLVRDQSSFDKPLCRLLQLPDGTPCPESYESKQLDLALWQHTVHGVLSDY